MTQCNPSKFYLFKKGDSEKIILTIDLDFSLLSLLITRTHGYNTNVVFGWDKMKLERIELNLNYIMGKV